MGADPPEIPGKTVEHNAESRFGLIIPDPFDLFGIDLINMLLDQVFILHDLGETFFIFCDQGLRCAYQGVDDQVFQLPEFGELTVQEAFVVVIDMGICPDNDIPFAIGDPLEGADGL